VATIQNESLVLRWGRAVQPTNKRILYLNILTPYQTEPREINTVIEMHVKTLHKGSTETVTEPSKCGCFTPQNSEEKYQPVFAWLHLTDEHI
jgi:hypothetical protein